MKARYRRRFLLLVLLALCLLLILWFRARITPIVEDLAAARVGNLISDVVNGAVAAEIREGGIDYDQIVTFEKDADGSIKALRTDMGEVNRLKSEILQEIDRRLYDLTVEQLSVPMGSLILPNFLSGRGPSIPVRIIAVSNNNAELENSFSAAGINQTLHQIMMEVSVDVTLLVPSGTMDLTVETESVVAETVLLGDVPQNYATLTGAPESAAIPYYATEN